MARDQRLENRFPIHSVLLVELCLAVALSRALEDQGNQGLMIELGHRFKLN